MGAPAQHRSQFLVDGPWINAIGRDPLLALLGPYKDFFLRHGINLDTVPNTLGWKYPIHEVILRPAEQMPSALKDSLVEVVRMGNPEGHELLLDFATKRGWDLGARGEKLSDQDMAVVAFLERPDLFDAARITLAIKQTRDFTDFFDKACGDLTPLLTPERMDRLTVRAKAYWKQRMRGDFAMVRTVQHDGWISFVIGHADLLRAHSIIRPEDASRDLMRLRLELSDKVQFHASTGRLSVASRYPKDAEGYRLMFGEVFWDQPNRYLKYTTYTGAPLMREGAKVLQPDPESGIAKVRAKEVVLVDERYPTYKFKVLCPKTPEALDRNLEHAKAEGLTRILSLTLGFKLEGARNEVEVALKTSNKLGLQRDIEGAETIFRFLVQRGFSLPPPRGGES